MVSKSVEAGRGRVRAHPGPSLSPVLLASCCTLLLVPPFSLVRLTSSLVAAWFSEVFLAPLRPALRLPWALAVPTLPLPMAPVLLPVSLVHRETEGGRRYAFYVPGYDGPRVVSARQFQGLPPGNRLLLPSIPRALRTAFPAPADQRFIVVDVDRCFPMLLATVAGDAELLEATRRDLHQEAGDVMAPHLTERERRMVGKLFNNAVVGLITPQGWQRTLARQGLPVDAERAARMHSGWWERFEKARQFRDRWVCFHQEAAHLRRPIRICNPDGRSYTFDVATVRGAAHRPQWAHLHSPEQRLDASIRTTFSAIWRGIEGLLLDRALLHLFPLREQGLRLVLPMYDGLLLQAPVDNANELVASVVAAFSEACFELGIPASVTVCVRSTWGESDPSLEDSRKVKCVM